MEDGLYKNLSRQYDRWRRRHNRKSFKTRERYDASMSPFMHYLADEFHLQKLANLKPKHLISYVQKRVSDGIAPSTIMTDLAGIRFFLDGYEDHLRTRPEVFPSNEDLRKDVEMQKRQSGGVIRAWSLNEFNTLVAIAYKLDRPIVGQAFGLAFWLGLRLDEVTQIDHARIQNALSNGLIAVKGKGDQWRDVPLCGEAKAILELASNRTARGERAFVERGRPVHKQKKSIQHFIGNHRRKIDNGRPITRAEMKILKELNAEPMEGPLVFHGLRHSYAMRQYRTARENSMTPLQARFHVSELLGHHRDEVTRIYLAGEPGGRNSKSSPIPIFSGGGAGGVNGRRPEGRSEAASPSGDCGACGQPCSWVVPKSTGRFYS